MCDLLNVPVCGHDFGTLYLFKYPFGTIVVVLWYTRYIFRTSRCTVRIWFHLCRAHSRMGRLTKSSEHSIVYLLICYRVLHRQMFAGKKCITRIFSLCVLLKYNFVYSLYQGHYCSYFVYSLCQGHSCSNLNPYMHLIFIQVVLL